MNDDFSLLDPIERHIVDVDDAERAGVFRQTRLDTRAMMRMRTSGRPLRIRWAAAAVVVLAAGAVWSTMFYTNLSGLRPDASVATIGECLVGPRTELPPSCSTYDLDGDGDVDMADLGAYQVRLAQR